MRSPSERTRWATTLIFAYHSREMAANPALAVALLTLSADSAPMVRMGALQALWQWYYWTEDDSIRARIVDAILARMAQPDHPWVTRNAREALYNVADENVRYLYNNWIPALANQTDRDAAIQAQQARDEMIAGKLAAALDSATPPGRENILRGLTEFHLRN